MLDHDKQWHPPDTPPPSEFKETVGDGMALMGATVPDGGHRQLVHASGMYFVRITGAAAIWIANTLAPGYSQEKVAQWHCLSPAAVAGAATRSFSYRLP